MNKNSIIFLIVVGLIGLFSSCEKDETKVVMLSSPVAPSIKTVPDLTLQRANGTNILTFIGTSVNPGFRASATYFLEACESGNNFKDSLQILSSTQDTLLKISVSDLNGILLKKFPADQVSSVDLRIRSVLSVDAGTGVAPKIYKSATKTVNVTIYGLPRLDITADAAVTGKVESALGDGKYFGIVKLDESKPFTLKDPDANITYGGSGGTLATDGAAITPSSTGWHKVTVDTKALTYKIEDFMIGLVGSATANGWNSPDQKMDYDSKTGTWKITTDLIDGQIKFRLNDGWAWNLGWNKEKTSLTHNGDNLDVTAGNYTITLTITSEAAPEAGTFTIVKN